MDDVRRVAAWLAGAQAVTVLTGAGISTESGIPDFRGPQGLWTRDPAAQRMFDIDAYVAHPEVRRAAWRSRHGHPAWTAEPNAGHRALGGFPVVGCQGTVVAFQGTAVGFQGTVVAFGAVLTRVHGWGR